MIIPFLIIYLISIVTAGIFLTLFVIKAKKVSPRRLIILFAGGVIIPLIAGYFYLAYFDALPETIVPDLTGMTFEAAEEKLAEADLQARKGGEVFEMKYEAGRVVSQRPEGGRKVKIGRTVNLMVSSGKRKVSVPDLLGRPVSEADALLSAAGLTLGEIRNEKNSEVMAGAILAQEPLPGESAEMGQKVDLLIVASAEAEESGSVPETKEENRTEEGGFKLW